MGITFPDPCEMCGKAVSIERGNQNIVVIHHYDANDTLKANVSYRLCNECSEEIKSRISEMFVEARR